MKIQWKQVVISICIGLVLGLGIAHWSVYRFLPMGHHGIKWKMTHDKDGRMSKRHERMRRRFEKKLDLTDEQKPKVEAILDQKRKSMSEMKETMYPRMRKLHKAAFHEIRLLLNDNQKKKLDEIEDRHAKRRAKYKSR